MNNKEEMSEELKIFYESQVYYSISGELKKRLHEIADKMVDKFMENTDLKLTYTKKADDMLGNDIVVVRVNAKRK